MSHGLTPGEISGEALRYAREQKRLTMREVEDLGGPSFGYQSDVERGRKPNVSKQKLDPWVAILDISVAFARGAIPRFDRNPAACQGLAADVGAWVLKQMAMPEWASLTTLQRLQVVLDRVANHSERFNPVMLAYALRLEVDVLREMIAGTQYIPDLQIPALTALTGLPEAVLRGADPDLMQAYLEAVTLAHCKGISPGQLKAMVDRE